MTIRMNEFDGINTGNKIPIHLIEHAVKITAPIDSKVNWEYPGYISIVLPNGTEIAFGESLESNSGYSWNDFDTNGTNNYADSFDDLGEIDLIVSKLWDQTKHLIKGDN